MKVFRLSAFIACIALLVSGTLSGQNYDREALTRSQARELIEDGEGQIEFGKRLLAKENDPNSLGGTIDVEAVHKRGRDLVKAGEEKIARGRQMLAELQAQREQVAKAFNEPTEQAYAASIKKAAWTPAIETAAAELMASLRANNYFDAVYYKTFIFDQLIYRQTEEVNNSVWAAVQKADGTRYTARKVNTVNLRNRDGRTRFVFPEEANVSTSGRTALVYGEILLEPGIGDGLLTLSAVDIGSWEIVASAQAIFPLDEDAAFDLITDAAEEGSRLLPVALSLIDKKGFIERIQGSDSNLVFGLDVDGSRRDFRMKIIPRLLKPLLVNESQIALVDTNFIRETFSFEEPEAEESGESGEDATDMGESPEVIAPETAQWVVALNPGVADESAVVLNAKSLVSENSVMVGPLVLGEVVVLETENVAEKK